MIDVITGTVLCSARGGGGRGGGGGGGRGGGGGGGGVVGLVCSCDPNIVFLPLS